MRDTTYRTITDAFRLSETALKRHRAGYTPAALTEARQVEAVESSGDLLGDVRSLQAKALTLPAKAEAAGDVRTALQGIREARACIELLLEVEGELDRRSVVNDIMSPQWIEIRAVLVAALDRYPDAGQAVARALASLEERNNDGGR